MLSKKHTNNASGPRRSTHSTGIMSTMQLVPTTTSHLAGDHGQRPGTSELQQYVCVGQQHQSENNNMRASKVDQ